MNRATPETDLLLSEFFSAATPSGGPCGQAVGSEKWRLVFTGNRRAEFEEAVRRLEQQRDELQAWKDSQLAVEAQWNPQVVAQLLGIGLGQDIRANIQPKIEEMIRQRDELLVALENLLFFHDECGMQSGHGDKARAAIAAMKGNQ